MSVAFVLKGYPRLSETFIAQEIRGLEARGLPIRIVSLRHPTDKQRHPVHGEIEAPVSYLPEYLYREPLRVLKGYRAARRLPGFAKAWWAFLADLRRDFTANRMRRFGQACVLAAELPADVTRLHFHFLHTPASVTRYAAMMRKLPWGGSAHAKDIWTSPDWDLREKLADLDWVTTCTAYGARHLKSLAPAPAKVHLDYHGIDLDRFPRADRTYTRTGGNAGEEPVTLVSVGRLVAKKGYDDLLAALGRLPKDLNWRFIHLGGGTLSDRFKQQAADLGISDRIEWRGAQPQTRVLEALRTADLFVLASKISEDGDRDGLPNVLMEAQTQGLAVLATDVSAIPELIDDGETGLLVPPQDPDALATALARLIREPDFRERLGRAGDMRVRQTFDAHTCLDALAAKFGLDTAEGYEGRMDVA